MATECNYGYWPGICRTSSLISLAIVRERYRLYGNLRPIATIVPYGESDSYGGFRRRIVPMCMCGDAIPGNQFTAREALRSKQQRVIRNNSNCSSGVRNMAG